MSRNRLSWPAELWDMHWTEQGMTGIIGGVTAAGVISDMWGATDAIFCDDQEIPAVITTEPSSKPAIELGAQNCQDQAQPYEFGLGVVIIPLCMVGVTALYAFVRNKIVK